MRIDLLIKWLIKMKVIGTKNIKIENNVIECYDAEGEKLGSKKIIKEV